jgi:hypothetical protein
MGKIKKNDTTPLLLTSKTYGNLTATERKQFINIFISGELDGIKDAIVKIKTALREHLVKWFSMTSSQTRTGDSIDDFDGNTRLNAIALFAHLLVDPEAADLWNNCHGSIVSSQKPQYLEQTDGVGNFKEIQYGKLVSYSKSFRESLNNDDILSIHHIPDDALDAMQDIDPRKGVLDSAKRLKELETTWVNKHDCLIGNLDASGGNLPEGSFERRTKCWESFVGPPGKSKDVALYYVFLVWEGKSTTFKSALLPPEHRREAGKETPVSLITTFGDDGSQDNGQDDREQEVPETDYQKRKRREEEKRMNQLKRMRVLLDKSEDVNEKESKELLQEANVNEKNSKAIYYQKLASTESEKALLTRGEHLLKVSSSSIFHTFAENDQEMIRQAIMENLGLRK